MSRKIQDSSHSLVRTSPSPFTSRTTPAIYIGYTTLYFQICHFFLGFGATKLSWLISSSLPL